MRILIVGAAGNLGSLLTTHLLATPHRLRLLLHRRAFPFALPAEAACEFARADLNDPASLSDVCSGIDCVVYLAGVLFEPRPERFLPRTNTIYVQNLVDAARAAWVKKFILVSFPHVEENTTPENPAKGVLDAQPRAIHAYTRLEAERYLFRACANSPMSAIVLRAGVIYGPGVKLIEAAHWLMSRRLMAVWRQPTWIHLLALADFMKITQIAIEKDRLDGIFNLCDDRPLLLQEFLDRLAEHWDCAKPWRLPVSAFHAAAIICESAAMICRTGAPLTRDLVRMGLTSVVADTNRMKRELLAELTYPGLDQGLKAL
jgi:nucleoside-diphosphate-sugar epimerase